MDGSTSSENSPVERVDRKPGARSRRRREIIDAAAVAGEVTAALIAGSRQLITLSNDLIARPHMAITSSSDRTPAPHQPILCEQCGLRIDTPGVAIVRGRNVMHVRCA